MKNWLKSSLCVAGLVGCLSLGLAGCGVQTDIKNQSNEIIYNGSVVSVVGDEIIFSNAYKSDDITSMSDYKSFANTAYLATTSSDGLVDVYTSPEKVTKLKSEVTGFGNMYSFVYGNNIYYAAPNKHKTSENQHVFTYVSFFLFFFDGSGTKEFLTTNSYDTATAQIRALKFGDNAYLFVYDGTALNVIDLQNDKVTLISDKATSVALPHEGEKWNGTVYYSEDKEHSYGQSGNAVKKYSLSESQSTNLSLSQNYTISFTGRTGDELFFTRTHTPTSVSNTFKEDATVFEGLELSTAGKSFYSASVSNVYATGGGNLQEGYLFTSSLSGNEQIMYMSSSSTQPQVFLANGDYSELLLVYGDLVYYSTSEGINYKVISSGEVVNVVSDMTIETSKLGYDFYETEQGAKPNLKNIYFYAQREYAEDDETEEEERDTGKYLYTVAANGQGKVKLVAEVDNPDSNSPNVALIASLSVVGGLVLIGGVVATIIIVKKKRGY